MKKIFSRNPKTVSISLVCLAMLFLNGCVGNNTFVNSTQTIEIKDSPERVSSQFDSLFRFSNYIIPQFTENSILGTINKVLIRDTTLYILHDKSKITSFGQDGAFIHTYSHVGQGPGEYPSISDFDISNDELFILSGKTIFRYDMADTFNGTINLENTAKGLCVLESGIALNNGFGVGNNNTKDLYSYSFYKFDGTEFNEVGFNRNLLGHEYSFNGGVNKFVNNGKDILIYFPYNETIYSIDQDGKLSPWVNINIGNNVTDDMPKSEVDDIIKSEIPSSIYSVYRFGDNLLFSYTIGQSSRLVLCSTGGQVSMNGIVGMDTNGFPVSISGLCSKSPCNKILSILPSALIKTLTSREENLDKYPILSEINNQVSLESNPVFIFYEPTFHPNK